MGRVVYYCFVLLFRLVKPVSMQLSLLSQLGK
nr:MAG TPA: hypothetical protein [Caudoviricetes sp.]